MRHKVSFLTGYTKRVHASIKTKGLRETIKTIKLRMKDRANNPVLDLIMLKPVKKPWKSPEKLRHEYDISVIIPTYNRAHMLPQLLKSWHKVDAATHYSYEIIFSDDGSNDNSIEILKNETNLPLQIIQNAHGGAAKARNSAIRAAKGKKLLIIGDDIFPNPQIINQHFEKLNELSVTDAVLGECVWHPDLKINHLMDHITELGCEQFSFVHFPKHSFTDFRHFYTCNISIDREFLLSEKVIFDESFYKVNFEDIELGYRLAKKGMKIYYYPEALGDHYHPYTDVKKFCIRQETAGEMALVFKRLHEEIEPIVNIDDIQTRWSRYSRRNSGSGKNNLYAELIDFCQYIEDHFKTRHSDISKDLSTVYAILFKFAYEKGVCSQGIAPDNFDLDSILVHEFFTSRLTKALQALNSHCQVPNYDTVVALSDARNESIPLLTLEATDAEHLDELIGRYGGLDDALRFRLKSPVPAKGMVYRPDKGFYIHKSNMRQILFFLQNHAEIDVVFLSFGLSDLPSVGVAGSLMNSCITSLPDLFEHDLINIKNVSKGKIIRIFEHFDGRKVLFLSLLNAAPEFFDDYGYFGKKSLAVSGRQGRFSPSAENDKPVVFVFPTFLAVGGVERNTAEIINRLKDQYDFVAVTFERLRESQGSLHHQFLRSCVGLFDLTELSSHDRIPEYLQQLNTLYSPQLVWICNGSPWLAANTANLRFIFKKSAIIDQEVYDTEAGWVRLYKERDAGLLSFDRFIAINSKIRDIFINTVGIDEQRVDLIYSVMSTEKRETALLNNREMLCKKFGLDSGEKYFVFIGRLTEQKAPMDLLKLIKLVVDKYGSAYKFIIVGNGELNEKVAKYIETNGLLNHVIRFDYIENTFEISMIAEAIVFTSLFEGLSIALLEALSVGTPGISTDVGDTKLIFDTYGNGITFETIGDIDEYFRVFDAFVAQYPCYKESAEKSKNKIAKQFGAEYISSQYLESFASAVSRMTVTQ